jgi:hypothetical protein
MDSVTRFSTIVFLNSTHGTHSWAEAVSNTIVFAKILGYENRIRAMPHSSESIFSLERQYHEIFLSSV